jgi:Cytochrome c oxidase subunit IV
MRVYGYFLAGVGAFFGVIAIIYWFTSYEDGGFLMLIGSALLGLFPGSYYLWWSTKMKPQADDDADADVAAGAGTVDSFPGSSIWPFVLGMGALFTVLTFIFGLWLAPLGAALILSGAIGATVESRRGQNPPVQAAGHIEATPEAH